MVPRWPPSPTAKRQEAQGLLASTAGRAYVAPRRSVGGFARACFIPKRSVLGLDGAHVTPLLQCCLALGEGVTWALLAIRTLEEEETWARGFPPKLRGRGKWARSSQLVHEELDDGALPVGVRCVLPPWRSHRWSHPSLLSRSFCLARLFNRGGVTFILYSAW